MRISDWSSDVCSSDLDHKAERAKEAAFYARQDERNKELVAGGKADRVKWRNYTGKATYLDQILTSPKTVALGFVIDTLIATPLASMCGLPLSLNAWVIPPYTTFKPVSTLVWWPMLH